MAKQAVACVKQTQVKITLIYTYTYTVTSATYHFLQAINKVTDNNTKAVELLEHGAELLAGAFAHICARLVRLLTYNVCSDGGTHVHNFCALAHDISIICGEQKKKKETLG